MNSPSILIVFDPETWAPEVFLNGATDEETGELKTRADKIVDVLRSGDDGSGNEER